jgi:biopolymer transport protein ExbD
MRFQRHLNLEYGLRQIVIVPLINILFLLLIFILSTTLFVIQPGIRLYLPRAVTSDVVKPGTLEITVSSENLVYVDTKPITIGALKTLLKQVAQRRQPVLIKSDSRASLGRVAEIWDMARDLGVAQVNIATTK